MDDFERLVTVGVKLLLGALLVVLLAGYLRDPLFLRAQGVTHFSAVTATGTVQGEQLTSTDDATITDDFTADVGTVFGLAATNNITVTGVVTVSGASGYKSAFDTEHVMLPTVSDVAVTYSSSGALWTVADGEIWIVHDVLIKVSSNFDCTGDDCTLKIGDGNDDNGLLDLVDAELQAADTEGTGFAAGWQGQLAATKGAYLVDSDFVYAPSGAAETIDITIGGTSPAAGAATVYIIYTRVQ